MNAGYLLKQARAAARLSQMEVGKRSEIPQSTISRIENDVLSPTIDTLSKLLNSCGMQLAIKPALDSVDRSLIREELRHSPVERIKRGVSSAESLKRLPRATNA